MKVRYRFRFYPTPQQQSQLTQVFGHTRFVYNWALQQRIDAWTNEENLSYYQLSAGLTALKKSPENHWLKAVSCVPLQQAIRHLDKAYVNFFAGRAKYPTFKKKRGNQTAEFTASAFTYQNGTLKLTRIGQLDVVWTRMFSSQPTTVTLIKTPSNRYFVTLILNETPQPFPKTNQVIGIDLGINRLATLSNGESITNLKLERTYGKKLAKTQRYLSRKIKGSGRWQRQRVKLARLKEKIANTRLDHHHKATTDLVKRFDIIAVEDLNVRGMVKNRKLAKHISDASFGKFVTLLTYKCAWRGKELRKVDRFFPSSKRCSNCGYVIDKLDLTIRQWQCPTCGSQHDRDENAAKNIIDFATGQVV